jgi:hypothetical protein
VPLEMGYRAERGGFERLSPVVQTSAFGGVDEVAAVCERRPCWFRLEILGRFANTVSNPLSSSRGNELPGGEIAFNTG